MCLGCGFIHNTAVVGYVSGLKTTAGICIAVIHKTRPAPPANVATVGLISNWLTRFDGNDFVSLSLPMMTWQLQLPTLLHPLYLCAKHSLGEQLAAEKPFTRFPKFSVKWANLIIILSWVMIIELEILQSLPPSHSRASISLCNNLTQSKSF